nr:dsDNA nuclease domain-containing protein [Exiguobacterium sp. s191]
MSGNFRDLGGLTAMRGFVYQYYVSMYYMVSMIYPKKESTWHSVILEYFDDVTLISEKNIRFIQVKTVREGEGKSHAPNNFTKRKSLKDDQYPKLHFNSWIEKNILNYDYFLESDFISDKNKSDYLPQFEIVTNTKQNSLSDLKKYTGNINFKIDDDIELDDKLKIGILKPVEKFNFNFNDFSKEKIDFYLKKLYINKFGSNRVLYENVIDMIEEIILIKDIRSKSIAEYVFGKLFGFVILKSHEDNEAVIKKEDLIITKSQIKELISQWVGEAKELISESSYYDSAWSIFNRAILDLELEIKEQFANNNLKSELLNELYLLNVHITENNRNNNTYCVLLINKIFNGNNSLSIWDFKHGNIKNNLKDSLRFMIYFLVFYEEHAEVYNTAKLLFHEGRSEMIDNILFTLYHARNNSNKVTSIEKLKISLNECQVSRKISLDLYCLLIGTKKDSINSEASDILNMFKATSNANSVHRITDVPDNMRFVDVDEIEDLFDGFKGEEIKLNTFKHDKLLPEWEKYLDGIVSKVKENYIES